MTTSLVEGNFAPLRPSGGIRCRFCGIGCYKAEKPSGRGFQIRGIGLTPVEGDVRVLICQHCGHVEWFQFAAIKDQKWWDK